MSIPPCPDLRRFAERVCSAGTPDLRYVDFWRGFPDEDDSSIRTMFRALFGGLGLRRPIVIWSVFGYHHTAPPDRHLRDDAFVHVAFSGEANHLDIYAHDLNLVMAPDNPRANVVSLINFATNAYEFGLWPRLTAARQRPKERFCVAVVSNGTAERRRFLARLQALRPIDSCGAWMNTTGFCAPRDERAFGDRYYPFLARYKFMVCFENARQPHYLTEKLLNAYAAGCVPIYWGAPEATSWLNPRAFIEVDVDSAAGMDAAIDEILRLDADDAAYDRVHREPLLIGDVPAVMRIESIREKIAHVLRRSRPDAF